MTQSFKNNKPNSADSMRHPSRAEVGQVKDETAELEEAVDDTGISERQRAAMPYLMMAPSVSEGARRAGVSRATIHRWLEEPKFKAALDKERGEVMDYVLSSVERLAADSLIVIGKAMQSNNLAMQLRASRMALEYCHKFSDTERLNERVEKLENALALYATKGRKL